MGVALATVASAVVLSVEVEVRAARKVDVEVAVGVEAACLAEVPVEVVWAWASLAGVEAGSRVVESEAAVRQAVSPVAAQEVAATHSSARSPPPAGTAS